MENKIKDYIYVTDYLFEKTGRKNYLVKLDEDNEPSSRGKIFFSDTDSSGFYKITVEKEKIGFLKRIQDSEIDFIVQDMIESDSIEIESINEMNTVDVKAIEGDFNIKYSTNGIAITIPPTDEITTRIKKTVFNYNITVNSSIRITMYEYVPQEVIDEVERKERKEAPSEFMRDYEADYGRAIEKIKKIANDPVWDYSMEKLKGNPSNRVHYDNGFAETKGFKEGAFNIKNNDWREQVTKITYSDLPTEFKNKIIKMEIDAVAMVDILWNKIKNSVIYKSIKDGDVLYAPEEGCIVFFGKKYKKNAGGYFESQYSKDFPLIEISNPDEILENEAIILIKRLYIIYKNYGRKELDRIISNIDYESIYEDDGDKKEFISSFVQPSGFEFPMVFKDYTVIYTSDDLRAVYRRRHTFLDESTAVISIYQIDGKLLSMRPRDDSYGFDADFSDSGRHVTVDDKNGLYMFINVTDKVFIKLRDCDSNKIKMIAILKEEGIINKRPE